MHIRELIIKLNDHFGIPTEIRHGVIAIDGCEGEKSLQVIKRYFPKIRISYPMLLKAILHQVEDRSFFIITNVKFLECNPKGKPQLIIHFQDRNKLTLVTWFNLVALKDKRKRIIRKQKPESNYRYGKESQLAYFYEAMPFPTPHKWWNALGNFKRLLFEIGPNDSIKHNENDAHYRLTQAIKWNMPLVTLEAKELMAYMHDEPSPVLVKSLSDPKEVLTQSLGSPNKQSYTTVLSNPLKASIDKDDIPF